jgi:hypothetical protein
MALVDGADGLFSTIWAKVHVPTYVEPVPGMTLWKNLPSRVIDYPFTVTIAAAFASPMISPAGEDP